MRRRSMRRTVVLTLAACLAGLAACGRDPEPLRGPRPVWAMKVGDLSAFTGRSFPGTAEPTEEVALSFRVGGPLVERPVDVGAKVEEGDLLARIDPQDFAVALESAEGRLDQAKADLAELRAGARPETIRALEAKVRAARASHDLAKTEEARFRQLLADNVVSQSEYDKSKLRMDVDKEELDAANEDLAQAQVARPEVIQAKEAEIRSLAAAVAHAENELAYTELRAPYGGEVSAVFVENYQTVQAKQPVCRLLDTTRIEFTIQIPEVLISSMELVRDLRVRFDAFPEHEIPAQVKHVRSEATLRTRTYPVTLIMDPPVGVRILPGMAGNVRGTATSPTGGAVEGLEIPVGAVFADEQDQQHVWVIDPDTRIVRIQPVQTQRMTSTGIRVTGLAPGTLIAIAGVHSLEEGQEVRILDAATGREAP